METLNLMENSIRHKTQIMVHPIHEREQQRESTSAPATAGSMWAQHQVPWARRLVRGPLEYGQDTPETPKAPQATKRQGTLFPLGMDGFIFMLASVKHSEELPYFFRAVQ